MADFGMTWRGPEVAAQVTGAKRNALGKGAALLLARTIPDVPLRDGPLSDSGATDVDDEAATVYFDTPYAVRQHEELGYQHPKRGKAKYLESHVVDDREVVSQVMAAEVRRALR